MKRRTRRGGSGYNYVLSEEQERQNLIDKIVAKKNKYPQLAPGWFTRNSVVRDKLEHVSLGDLRVLDREHEGGRTRRKSRTTRRKRH